MCSYVYAHGEGGLSLPPSHFVIESLLDLELTDWARLGARELQGTRLEPSYLDNKWFTN